ncbi:MAG: glycosyltransferase family protein [Ignavibacteria bacterium]|nr:glycosyltransferase family protein [Ignavibacteria bacterium]
MNIVTIIQARTGSTRLPGKVLLEAAGKPLLRHMVERVKYSKFAGTIVVATTLESADDPIAELCRLNNINCFRGSTNDLLERHYKAALVYSADVVLKIPADCPLIDPYIIDRIIVQYLRYRKEIDYLSNLHPASYPDGNDVEVFSFKSIYLAHKNAVMDFEREHTTPYIWNNPDKFRIGNIKWETGLDFSNKYRLVLDYSEDYKLIKEIFENLYFSKTIFRLSDIIDFLIKQPLIAGINSHLKGINWYSKYRNEISANNKASIQFQTT